MLNPLCRPDPHVLAQPQGILSEAAEGEKRREKEDLRGFRNLGAEVISLI